MTDFLYTLLITAPISVFLTGIFRLSFLSSENRIVPYLIAGASSILFAAFFKMKTKWKIVSAGTFVGISVILLYLAKKEEVLEKLPEYGWCGTIVGISVIAYLLGMVLTKYVRMKGVLSLLVLAYLIFSMVMGKKLCKADTISSGIIILTTVAELIQKYWKKEGYTDRKMHTVTIAPFFLAIFAIIGVLNTPQKAYDWQFFIDAGQTIKHGYIAVTQKIFSGNKEGYASVYAGFSDDGELHPDISQNNNRVMTFTPSVYAPNKVYLAGIVSDEFDGKAWHATNNYDEKDIAIDAAETLYAAEMYADSLASDYVRIDGGSVTHTYFSTRYAFIPSKTLSFEPVDANVKFSENGNSIQFDKIQGYGTTYDFRYVMMNSNSPYFLEFANAEHPSDEESFNKFTYKSYYSAVEDLNYDDLCAHRERIKSIYLPTTVISDEAREMLSEITDGADTDYEKLKCIEKYLQGYEYTWHPGEYPDYAKTPEGFLDYFLFENKQGYCSYYATAFVLLARAEGIPARYVQGYSFYTDGSKTVDVIGKNAHAWPEAYIEGLGWVVFEPTGGGNGISFGSSGYSGYWLTQEEKAAEYEERYKNTLEEKEEIEEKKEIDEEEAEKKKNVSLVIVIPVLSAVITLLFITVFEKTLAKKKYDKASFDDKVLIICKKNMRLLKIAGFKQNKNETLSEYQKRLSKDLPLESLGFIIIYERLLYSDTKMTKDDADAARRGYESIFEQIRVKRGRFVYLVQKCLAGTGFDI